MYRKSVAVVLFVAVSLGASMAQGASPCPPKADDIKDIRTGASKHLACEWLRPAAIEPMLRAMKHYNEGEMHWQEAVNEVKNVAIDDDWSFYEAAQGVKDPDGNPSIQGRGAFLEMLATANTLDWEKKTEGDGCCPDKDGCCPDKKACLFCEAKKVIEKIFDRNKQALVNVDNHFRQEQMYYKGLYELLIAVPKTDQYAKDLEVLRAAFKDDRGKLADLVAARIFPAK